MNILAVNQNEFQILEIEDMTKNIQSKIFFAKTILDAIKIVEEICINTVLINITSISDIGFIKYINDNFEDISIILATEKEFEEAISVIQTGKFKLLHYPFLLKELKKEIYLEEL